MVEWIVFIVGAAICLAGAFGVVTSESPVHAALSLVGTLIGVAVLFVAQDAEFLAAVQVIVYAGAVVVLILFVIMLLGVDKIDNIRVEPLAGQRVAAVVAGVLLAGGLIGVVTVGSITGELSVAAPLDADIPNVTQIGRVLFTDYLFAFEITSILLVIAVVGAVALGQHKREAIDSADLVDEPPVAREPEVIDDEEVAS